MMFLAGKIHGVAGGCIGLFGWRFFGLFRQEKGSQYGPPGMKI